jgi:hypothetical protein
VVIWKYFRKTEATLRRWNWQRQAGLAATLRVPADWVNLFAAVLEGVFSTTSNAIFRQGIFDSLSKIKFRFFLVGFARGF